MTIVQSHFFMSNLRNTLVAFTTFGLKKNSLQLLLRDKWYAAHETIRHRFKGVFVIQQIASVKTKLMIGLQCFTFRFTW